MKAHFQFHNELKLFAEVDHHAKFSINVYAATTDGRDFTHIANLYAPKTIFACFGHNGHGTVPGIKDEGNTWNVQGHAERIIRVTGDDLAIFARLYDAPETPPMQARLPALHSSRLISVLRKFVAQTTRLGDLEGEYFSTEMWHETNAQKDGTIRRETSFPDSAGNWILSGPHFFVGNPFYKTSRSTCRLNSDYDILDLTELPDDYLPRTNYVPDCDPAEYLRRTPRVPWGDRKPVTEFYRLVYRGMIGSAGERTLIPVLIPKGVAHIHTILSLLSNSSKFISMFIGLSSSIIFDFYIKSTGRPHLYGSVLENMPFFESPNIMLRIDAEIKSHFQDLGEVCLHTRRLC